MDNRNKLLLPLVENAGDDDNDDDEEVMGPNRGYGPGSIRGSLRGNSPTRRSASQHRDRRSLSPRRSAPSPHRNARSHSPGPASRFHGQNALLNSCRPRRPSTLFSPICGAVSESLAFPFYPDCAHCARLLETNARWGTGLCDLCYNRVDKECKICCQRLHVKQLKWGSGLCNPCYDACVKTCQFCNQRLEFSQLHWRTGLCDLCYDTSDKICRLCSSVLGMEMLRWGSGMCDVCYDSCDKSCKFCQTRLKLGVMKWGTGMCDGCYNRPENKCKICKSMLSFNYGTGLCNTCYDSCEKECIKCQVRLPLGQLHYRSALCDDCYDRSEKSCKKCKILLGKSHYKWDSGICNGCYDLVEKTCAVCQQHIAMHALHWDSGLCDPCWNKSDKTCRTCSRLLPIGEVRWGTSLCNGCYDYCEKQCRICSGVMPYGSLRWGTGLCDSCYDSYDKVCRICDTQLQLGDLQWGTGLCDTCFDKCEKKCRKCDCRLPFGQLFFATGYCNRCYDHMKADEHKKGLTPAIWTAIGVQLVFYMAPAIMQPSLFLEIKASQWGKLDAQSSYALILTVASLVAMIAPVPLGLWAERKGEREVYVGVTLFAAFSGIALGLAPNLSAFATAWGLLNAPPAIRGVRAVLFARHVEPDELSRAGQLASSLGLLGSVLGPIAATIVQQTVGDKFNFTTCAFIAMVAHLASAVALQLKLPTPEKRKKHEVQDSGKKEDLHESFVFCEQCSDQLSAEEARYRSSLCKRCYDNWGGVEGYSFERFKLKVVISFCAVAALLEVSMNAGVLATFQPIAVDQLGWGSTEIAAVNGVSAALSVVVSLGASHLRLNEGCQVALAAGLYVGGVFFFTMPPTRTWNVLIGLVLGLKAQILFMAPFTSIFSRVIGRTRVTNRLTISLCLAPGVGGAIGTVLSPFFLTVANTPWFMMATIPAIVAWCVILWHVFRGTDQRMSQI